ncbi:hypothetical protein C8R44DRAFT_817299 [Mycena epipterygia]|nr:hypothetical protein C8R44DRAFT_817299 [Mycena epipterygia]
MTPPRTSTSTSKESQDSERRGTERHLDWLPQTPPASRALGPAAPSEHPSGTRDENSHEPRNGNGMQNRYLNLANASASLEAAPGPLCSPSGSATSSGGSEPRGPEVELSPIEQFMDTSNRTKDYMLMLERRLSAAEKSNDAKAERMERLLEEIDILKARNADLERRLAS